jgi:hypothetical protein
MSMIWRSFNGDVGRKGNGCYDRYFIGVFCLYYILVEFTCYHYCGVKRRCRRLYLTSKSMSSI